MLFKYTSFDVEGHCLAGHVWALEESQACDLVMMTGKQPVDMRRVTWVRRRLKSLELIDLMLYLEWMLRAGVPLGEALQELAHSAQTVTQQQVALSLLQYMQSGLLFSQAMALLPEVFSPVAIYYVKVGEKSGHLAQQLGVLVAALQWQNTWQDKLARVFVYPLLTLVIAVMALCYLLLDVVPGLVGFLPASEVPASLERILRCKTWIAANSGVIVLFGTACLILSAVSMRYSARCRYLRDGLLLRLPGVGRVCHDIELTRMVEVIGHLHGTGFTVLECLSVVQDLTRNLVVRRHIAEVTEAMTAGVHITRSFAAIPFFPPILLRALYLAENTGQLAPALTHAADFFRVRTTKRMQFLETSLPPLCLFVVGGMLAAVVWIVFTPLFNMLGQI